MTEALGQMVLGSWFLDEWRTRDVAGATAYPLGSRAVGRLIYASDGQMSGLMMRADRAAFGCPATEAVDRDGGTDAEVRRAFDDVFGYAGSYTVDESTAVVRHVIEVCVLPGWTGRVLTRHVRLSSDASVLHLISEPRLARGVEQRAHLRWLRRRPAGDR